MALDRQRLEIIEGDECLELVRAAKIGRIGYLENGVPHIVPVNHVLDGWTLLFRSVVGGKLVAAASEQNLTFQVDGWDAEAGTGWSVMVKGVGEVTPTPALEERIDQAAKARLEAWAIDDSEHSTWVRLHVNEITGRRITGESKAP